MARPLRIERAGAWYHITSRANERKALFRDDRDRKHFCEVLAEAVERFGLRLHSWVLMDNHYHLLLETTEANLSRTMQWLNVSYTVWFNLRHQRSGHLLQGRYKAIVVDPLGWGMELSGYIHLNPVRVKGFGLHKAVRSASRVGAGVPPSSQQVHERLRRLRSYRWSSYRAYLGLTPAPPWLTCGRVLELGGGRSRGEQRTSYRIWVESALRQGVVENPWEKLTAQVVLGGEEFVRKVRQELRGDEREQPALRQLSSRPTLAAVIIAVEQAKGESWKQFRDRHGDWGRDLVLYLARIFHKPKDFSEKPATFSKICSVGLLENCGGPTTRGKLRREDENPIFPGVLIDSPAFRNFSRVGFSTGCGPPV